MLLLLPVVVEIAVYRMEAKPLRMGHGPYRGPARDPSLRSLFSKYTTDRSAQVGHPGLYRYERVEVGHEEVRGEQHDTLPVRKRQMALRVAQKLDAHGRRNRPRARIRRSDARKGPIREECDGEVGCDETHEPWSTEHVENGRNIRAADGTAGREGGQRSSGDSPNPACTPDRTVAGIVADPQVAGRVEREHIRLGGNEREVRSIRSRSVRAALGHKRVESVGGNVTPDLAATGKRIGNSEVQRTDGVGSDPRVDDAGESIGNWCGVAAARTAGGVLDYRQRVDGGYVQVASDKRERAGRMARGCAANLLDDLGNASSRIHNFLNVPTFEESDVQVSIRSD